jgi:transcription elongation factor GreA
MSDKVPMTREGYESLIQEVKRLKEVERPKIVKEIGIAREHGDLSENAEYHAAKEKQSLIEGRIKDLESKLAGAELLDTSQAKPGVVVFGSTVCLEDEDTGDKVTYRIVGADEADIKQKTISINSPIARALIAHKIGDSVEVVVPSGTKEFNILDVILK